MGKLSGKVAVVTGASKGIRASMAEHMAAEGASVVANYVGSRSEADAVVARTTEKGGNATAVHGNISVMKDIQRRFAETKEAYGKLDILVNNAGICEFAPLEAITPEHIQKQVNLNLIGLIFATQEAVKQMGPEGGAIVNIGSMVGSMRALQASVSSATKAAVDASSISLSQEQDPRELARSRCCGDGRASRILTQRGDISRSARHANSSGTNRATGQHRTSGGFSGQR